MIQFLTKALPFFFYKISKTRFKNDGTVAYGHNSNPGSHDVYYLDQFSFIVNED